MAFDTLTAGAAAFGLSHRTLGVLRALLTFLPGRLIPPVPGGAIVFPSNRTLSARLAGMPESTLRRHLAHLVGADIIRRRDSPNRKRYARRGGQTAGIAFGIDLAPLAARIATFQGAAQTAQADAADLAVLRARVAALRAGLLDRDGPCPLTEDVRRALRRAPCADVFGALHAALAARMEETRSDCSTVVVSGTDARNERHIQTENIYLSDSEAPGDVLMPQNSKPALATKNRSAENEDGPDLAQVLGRCTEFRCYFPEAVRSWGDLAGIASRLAPMIAIDLPVFQEAARVMGLRRATTVVLCIVENLGRIRSPGAYLRQLTRTAREGGFSILPFLNAVARPKLSADNP